MIEAVEPLYHDAYAVCVICLETFLRLMNGRGKYVYRGAHRDGYECLKNQNARWWKWKPWNEKAKERKMRKGIVTVEVDDPSSAVVNVRDERGNVTECYNIGEILQDRHRTREDLKVVLEREEIALRNIAELKAESQEWRDRAYKRGEEAREIGKKYDALKTSQIPNGTPLYMIDAKLVDGLKTLVGMKMGPITVVPRDPVWLPIYSAPKDEFKFILICGDPLIREARTASWKGNAWKSVCATCSYEPTHWMPLPEAPR